MEFKIVSGGSISALETNINTEYSNGYVPEGSPHYNSFENMWYQRLRLNAPRDIVITNANTDAGVPRVAIEKSDKGGITFYSQDFCNRRTWFQNSTRVVDEVASNSTTLEYIEYELANTNIIDVTHGLIMDEDNLVDDNGLDYKIHVKKNGEEVSEVDPHTGIGDYTVNHAAGTISFLVANSPSDTIEVSYCHAQGSLYKIVPPADKKYLIDMVEIQFASDVIMKDSVVFEVYGYAVAFVPERTNPELIDPNSTLYNPSMYIPPLTKIPIQTKKYKTVRNLLDDAVKAYSKYPAISSSNWRGTLQETVVMDWDYVRSIPLLGTAGMEMHLYLEHDEEFEGEFATATFYCNQQDI